MSFRLSFQVYDDVIKWKHFRVTGPLWGESTGHRWILLTKASDTELLCFLWSATEQTIEQTIDTVMIWDAIALIMIYHCDVEYVSLFS